MLMRRLVTAAAAAFLALGALPGAAQAQAQTGDPSFTLVNRSTRTIYEARASLTTENSWGEDRLGTTVIPPGRTFLIRLPAGPCMYDVRVVYDRANGPAEERRNINLCNLTELAFDGRQAQQGGPGQQGGQAPQQQARPPQAGPSGNPSFNLVNQGRTTVMQVFASLATDNNWGPDRLGADTVAPGAVYPIRLPEGPCMYDIRFVYDNGQPQERRNINLCNETNIIVPLQ